MRLGPFEIKRAIGKGGMAVVWLARHVELDRDVAIKVLTTERAREEEYIRGMEHEIRACARLHHPGIVDIFEVGELPTQIAGQLGLRTGSPYYVMEYIHGGTLKELVNHEDWGWPMVRKVLMDVLNALAHAHARKIVHRDLKPANILYRETEDGVEALLADFGVAASRELDTKTRPDLLRVTGTPKYMAPEQIKAEWRDHGPWTDLYSLGCIAYWMVTGKAPYEGKHHIEILKAHLSKAPKPINPNIPIPGGFKAWVMTLLNKDLHDRFQTAADARFALGELQAFGSPDTTTLVPTDVDATLPAMGNEASLFTAEISGDLFGISRKIRPPLEEDWRRDGGEKRDQRLLGAGLKLFSFRSIPFVDRVVERDAMWSMLQQVHETRTPRAVLVEGSAGTGKSRLVEWISQRAEEMGAATVLKASASDFDPDGRSLGHMVAGYFHIENLTGERAAKRIDDGMQAIGPRAGQRDEAAKMDAYILQRIAEGTNDPNLTVPEGDRVSALCRLVERISSQRPTIVWLDNAHLCPSAITLIDKILNSPDGHPVLVMATLRTEEITRNEALTRWMDHISRRADTVRLHINELGKDDQRDLVRQLLLLDDAVVDRIVKSTGGNPLFAVELIGEWIRKGKLVARENGFALAQGAELGVPTAVHEVWSERIKNILGDFNDSESLTQALEVAALMESPINPADWRRTCAMLGLVLPSNLIPALLEYRVLNGTPTSFNFSHELLRDSLIRTARKGPRWQEYNKVCAQLLQERPRRDDAYLAHLGNYLLESGQAERAAELLRDAAQAAMDKENDEATMRLLQAHLAAIRAAGIPPTSHDAIFNTMRTLIMRRRRGDDINPIEVHGVRARARQHGYWLEYAHATRMHAAIEGHHSLERSHKVLEEAAEALRPLGGLPYGMILNGLGRSTMYMGDIERAISLQEEAIDIFYLLDNTNWLLTAKLSLIYALSQVGENHRARLEIEAVLDVAEPAGLRDAVAEAYCYLGEVTRHEGQFKDALGAYSAAHKLVVDWDAANVAAIEMNMALCQLCLGQFENAHMAFMKLKENELNHVAIEGGLELALCATTAHFGKWKSFDIHWEKARRLLGDAVDYDLAMTAEVAGDVASERGDEVRSQELYRYSETIWSTLGRERDLERIRKKFLRP